MHEYKKDWARHPSNGKGKNKRACRSAWPATRRWALAVQEPMVNNQEDNWRREQQRAILGHQILLEAWIVLFSCYEQEQSKTAQKETNVIASHLWPRALAEQEPVTDNQKDSWRREQRRAISENQILLEVNEWIVLFSRYDTVQSETAKGKRAYHSESLATVSSCRTTTGAEQSEIVDGANSAGRHLSIVSFRGGAHNTKRMDWARHSYSHTVENTQKHAK